MMASMKEAWRARAPRERAFLSIGAGFLGLVLVYLLAVDPMLAAGRKAERALPELRRQDAAMTALAERARELRAQPLPAAAVPDPAALGEQARRAGLALQLAPADDGSVSVKVDQVAAAALFGWLADVQDGSRLFVREADLGASGPGKVSGTLSLAP